ncbi:MAG: aldehyde dehydrogenase family protein [Bacteroidetes bacterium HGW-Bacteroidetes-1]|jgi:acyl-CoA reductase-like NAD-dependent aldehyde dehydrogenase|nr:MAG: aldehyde dehydrogenase family protein [Bacteroidetes bacterium HGW-Bacteroidetes-1]
MTENLYSTIITKQKAFYNENHSLEISFRKKKLTQLKTIIKNHEQALMDALRKDLGKSAFESYATEIGIVYDEISLHLKKISSWTGVKRVGTPITSFPASSYLQAEPYGVVLIISPWNYPFQLAIAPLVAAISAGNCAIIKPSELSPHTSLLLEEMINNNFEPDYIKVINGGAKVSEQLLKEKFNMIFFTGSPRVGKIVMKAAAEHLTPVVLELGGKSPCIVDKDVDIKLVVKRILWGKCINAGQTCIAPDYVLVHENIKEKFIQQCEVVLKEMYGENIELSADYSRIINPSNVVRLQTLMLTGKIVLGGKLNTDTLYFSPTIIENPDPDSLLMQEEIFGPLLPVITYKDIEEAIHFVRKKPKPLALYVFTNHKGNLKQILKKISAGGVTVNDTIMHFTNPNLPFGGVGTSGMGNYHGKSGFMAFSHMKPIMKRANWLDVPLRYPPFGNKLKLIRLLLK